MKKSQGKTVISSDAAGDKDKIGSESKAGAGEDIDVLPPEILQALPPEMRERVRETIGIVSAPMQNPIAKKITSDHITAIITNDDKDLERRNRQKTMSRFFNLAYVLIAIGAFFLLSVLFAKDDPELFKDILKFFGTFFAGFGAGWGFTTFTSGNKP